jgi:hypothetical protein
MLVRRGHALWALSLLAVLHPGTVWCATPRAYLSWHAPYGTPGASDTLMASGGDASRKDTLYVTFRTGKSSGYFVGCETILLFRAALHDTLSPHWWFEQKNLEIQFGVDSIPGATRAWSVPMSASLTFYDRSRGSGRLRLSNVRPSSLPVAVRDSVQYFYARILVPRPSPGVPGGDRPICIQCAQMELIFMYADTDTSVEIGREGHRFTSWNSGDAKVCADYRDDAPPPAASATPAAPPRKGKKPPRKKP